MAGPFSGKSVKASQGRTRFGRFARKAVSTLTRFDPIKDTVGFRSGGSFTASNTPKGGAAKRADGEEGIALPRRDYGPTNS